MTDKASWTRLRGRAGLIATAYLAAFMALLDVNIVRLALPNLQSDLGASPGIQQWVMNAYVLCLSTVALSAGALGDRYGRKRVLVIGVTLFTIGSAVCAAAPTPVVLVVGRFIQGIGAAIASPVSLSLIAQAFPEPGERARVIGGWASVSGAAGLFGPILGGVLVDAFGWQSIFWINLPLGVLTIFLCLRSVSESSSVDRAPLDLPGQLLGILWLGALSYGLINAGDHGWAVPSTTIPLGIALVGFIAFVVVEARREHPMLPVRWFTERAFVLPNVGVAALGFSAMSMTIFLPTFLQQAQGHSASVTSLLLLPSAAVGLVAPVLAGRWVAASGPRLPMATGLVLIVGCMAALLAATPDSGYFAVFVALVLLGAGNGLTTAPSNAAVMNAVGPKHSGIGSGTASAVRQTGTSVGIALLGSLLVQQTLGSTGAAYPAAYTGGMHLIAIIAGLVALAGVVVVLLPARPRSGELPADITVDESRSGDDADEGVRSSSSGTG